MVAPLVIRAAIKAGKTIVKKKKKAASQSTTPKKTPKLRREEAQARKDTKGQIGAKSKIKELKEQEKVGLISTGERQQALNKMTKGHKEGTKRIEKLSRQISQKRKITK